MSVMETLALNAAKTEQRGRPAEASIEAARSAGAFALRTPVTEGSFLSS
jgi:hypothetical protein